MIVSLEADLMARLFGTDGVRGIANAHLNAELAYKLGRAAAQYFGREVKSPKIIIGRDTRLSGTMLESALAAGICSAGGNAHLLGVIPTPAVSYLTEKLGAALVLSFLPPTIPLKIMASSFLLRPVSSFPMPWKTKLKPL